MDDLLSILLIENQVSVAIAINEGISRFFASYRLSVSRALLEAVSEVEPAEVILLAASQFQDQALFLLHQAYPDIPIVLLLEPAFMAGRTGEELLLQALSAGITDYLILDKAGFWVLGQRLKSLLAQRRPPPDRPESASIKAAAALLSGSQVLVKAWNTPVVLDHLLRHLVETFQAGGGLLLSWRQGQAHGAPIAYFSPENGTAGQRPFIPVTLLRPGQRPLLLAALTDQQPAVILAGRPEVAGTEAFYMQQNNWLSLLILPLWTATETIGWIELYDKNEARSFTGPERDLAVTLANYAAVALENLQQHQQARQALHETEALYQVARALATTQDSQTILSTVLQEYLRALRLKQGSIIFFDFEEKCGVVKVNFKDDQPSPYARPAGEADNAGHGGLEGQKIPLKNNAIYEMLMRTYQPVIVNDTQTSPLTRTSLTQARWAGPEALSLLITPIEIRGEIVGALVVEATRSHHTFESWEVSLSQTMADQLGLALRNVQLYEAEYQRRQQAETLREVSFVVGSSLNLDDVLERILDQLGRVVKYDSAAIHLIEGKQRRIIAGRGFAHPERILGMSFPIEVDREEPGSLVIFTRQPVVVGNVAELYPVFQEFPHNIIKSWMGIPLIARGRVIGLISIDQAQPNAFTRDDVELAQAFANQVAVALENARLYELEVRELERELEIAQGIQETLLPEFVPQVPGLQICGRLLPARQIGGDFFHFFKVGDEQLGVAIGDVSGKGIPAALYMAVAITAIDINIKNQLTPAQLLNQLNENLYHRLRSNRMNIGLQVVTFAPLAPQAVASSESEPEARGAVVTIASAGMIAPIGATPHGCRFLPVSGLPLGVLPSPEHVYPDEMFLLDPFTTVIFTSDGIVEARNESGELFGFDRLEMTVNEIIHTRDAETIAEHIIHTAQAFTGEFEQHDDMTVVVVVKT